MFLTSWAPHADFFHVSRNLLQLAPFVECTPSPAELHTHPDYYRKSRSLLCNEAAANYIWLWKFRLVEFNKTKWKSVHPSYGTPFNCSRVASPSSQIGLLNTTVPILCSSGIVCDSSASWFEFSIHVRHFMEGPDPGRRLFPVQPHSQGRERSPAQFAERVRRGSSLVLSLFLISQIQCLCWQNYKLSATVDFSSNGT